jgi:hypothetical protein
LNVKNMTVALIIAVVYTILLKLSHVVAPSLFELSAVGTVKAVLSVAVGVVIILFLLSCHHEEGADGRLAAALKLLIGCFVLRVVLRLAGAGEAIDHQALRLAGDVVGVAVSALLFVVMVLYVGRVPSGQGPLKRASALVAVMFGIGVVKSLVSLGYLVRFAASGAMTEFPPALYNAMLVLFLVTNGSILYFLFRYYELKSAPRGRRA